MQRPILGVCQNSEYTLELNHPNTYFQKLVAVNEIIFQQPVQFGACNFTKNDFLAGYFKGFCGIPMNIH